VNSKICPVELTFAVTTPVAELMFVMLQQAGVVAGVRAPLAGCPLAPRAADGLAGCGADGEGAAGVATGAGGGGAEPLSQVPLPAIPSLQTLGDGQGGHFRQKRP
jgi:hypothetical protein